MAVQKIWHVSEGRKFPMEIRKQSLPSFEIVELEPADLGAVKPEPDGLHVFLIQGERGGLAAMRNLVEATPHLRDFPRVLVLSQEDYLNYVPDRHSKSLIVLDDTVRPGILKTILEMVLKIEFYRQVVFKMSRDIREQSDMRERMIEMARNEVRDAREESRAYQALLAYESSHHRFENQVQTAMERAMVWKDHELLDMKETVSAFERLSQYRDKEAAEMRKRIEATESVLTLSQQENLDRERIIQAMERLRRLTDQEIMELFEENQMLRSRLGLPERNPAKKD